MQIAIPRITARLTVLAAAGLLLPQLAFAQTAIPGGAASSLIRPEQKHTKKIAPPPALPGASSTESAAPPTQTPSDMSPNAALFDAINRGDIAAARDALSRGAQLSAKNVLGLTPIELAVDLGRNDIAFLLLSMRGAEGNDTAGPPPGQGQQAAAKAPAAHRPRPVQRTVAHKAPRVTPAARPEEAQLFAHDGGTPIPSIGFLGFGPQRGSP